MNERTTSRHLDGRHPRWRRRPAWPAMRVLAAVVAVFCQFVELAVGADTAPREVVVKATDSWHIDHETHHVQGLAVSAESFWISSVERGRHVGYVFRYDRATGTVVEQVELADGDQYHPGGMQRAGGRLWIPLAEYRPRSTAKVLSLDAESLQRTSEFTVDDHLGAVAATEKMIYAANWDARKIYVYDLEGNAVRVIENPTSLAIQDMEIHAGMIYATGRIRRNGASVGVVEVIEPADWSTSMRYVLEGTQRSGRSNFGREGFCLFEGDLYLLPEDGPDTTVYRFAIDQEGGE